MEHCYRTHLHYGTTGSYIATLKIMSRDFHALVNKLRHQQGSQSHVSAPLHHHPSQASRHEDSTTVMTAHGPSSRYFGGAVAELSRQIHATSRKLSRMTQCKTPYTEYKSYCSWYTTMSMNAVVRQRGLMKDTQTQVNDLTVEIKDDITFLNNKLDALQQYAETQKRQLQTQDPQSAQKASHSVVVVNGLKSKLMNTTQEFRSVLKDRTSSMKANTQRKALYGDNRDLGKPLVYRNRRHAIEARKGASSAHAPNHDTSSGSSNHHNVHGSGNHQHHSDYDPEAGHSLEGHKIATPSAHSNKISHSQNSDGYQGAFQQVALQLERTQQGDADYLSTRADDVSTIESHIQELGNIFQRLSTMVSEQSQMVTRLDDNVDNMLQNIELGESQLQRRYDTVSSNWRLALKIIAVLLFFAVFFTVFVA